VQCFILQFYPELKAIVFNKTKMTKITGKKETGPWVKLLKPRQSGWL